MHRMGERIKRRRESLNIQTNDLAKAIGVTSSLISQIERAKAFPSILTLKKIADALQTTVGEIIGENATYIENPLLNANERKFARKNKNGASVFLLSHHDPLKQMDPFIINFEAKGNSKEIMTPTNPRQEFCFVLSGAFDVDLNGKKYRINQGDSFYFISNQKHLFTNVSNEKAQLLWVVNQANV
jgi:XRE family transcriptional regulator, regulator of sulfur utilization